MVLVGTHLDMDNSTSTYRKVPKKDAMKMGTLYQCPTIELSSKTGQYTELAFELLVKEILKNKNPTYTSLERSSSNSSNGNNTNSNTPPGRRPKRFTIGPMKRLNGSNTSTGSNNNENESESER